MKVRKYYENDLPEMIRIWNEVVEEGIAFPQEELLGMESGAEFFASLKRTDRYLDYISCIRIMSADAAISVMQVMRFHQMRVEDT